MKTKKKLNKKQHKKLKAKLLFKVESLMVDLMCYKEVRLFWSLVKIKNEIMENTK